MSFKLVNPQIEKKLQGDFPCPNINLSGANMAVFIDNLSRQIEQLSQQQQVAYQTSSLAERINYKYSVCFQKFFDLINFNQIDFLTDTEINTLVTSILGTKIMQQDVNTVALKRMVEEYRMFKPNISRKSDLFTS